MQILKLNCYPKKNLLNGTKIISGEYDSSKSQILINNNLTKIEEQKSLRRGRLELFEGGQVSDIVNALPVLVCPLPVSQNISSVFSFIISRFPDKIATHEDFSPSKQREIPFIKKLKLTTTIPL
jgi:hypothetical protein